MAQPNKINAIQRVLLNQARGYAALAHQLCLNGEDNSHYKQGATHCLTLLNAHRKSSEMTRTLIPTSITKMSYKENRGFSGLLMGLAILAHILIYLNDGI